MDFNLKLHREFKLQTHTVQSAYRKRKGREAESDGMYSQKQANYLGLQKHPDNNDTMNEGSNHREKIDEKGKI